MDAAPVYESEDVDTVVEEESYQELIPPASKKAAVGKKVWDLVEFNINYKENQGLHAKWTENYNFGHNEHWKQKTKKGVPMISGNLMYAHRQRTINHLTDNNPTFDLRSND